MKPQHARWQRYALLTLAGLLAIYSGGCFLVTRAIDETYSSDWRSTSSDHARRRGVFVAMPVVVPAVLRASDAMDWRVTDAWVERPTHVAYRWLFLRQEIQDSAYRLEVHLVKTPHGDSTWTSITRRCFLYADILANGKQGGRSGDFATESLFLTSPAPFPDTVRLSIVRHPKVAPPPGAPPSNTIDCP